MDTSYLTCTVHPATEQMHVPEWAHAAARQGSRRALELLRSTILPDSVILTLHPHAAAPFGTEIEEGETAFSAHTAHDISISYPTALGLKGLEMEVDSEKRAFEILSYCAANETAIFALSSMTPDAEEEIRCTAEVIASIASGFRLVPVSVNGDHYGILRVFLRCLIGIRDAESNAALWRGEVRRMIEEMCEHIGFEETPGHISKKGQRLSPDEIHALIDYADGKGPWPYRAAS